MARPYRRRVGNVDVNADISGGELSETGGSIKAFVEREPQEDCRQTDVGLKFEVLWCILADRDCKSTEGDVDMNGKFYVFCGRMAACAAVVALCVVGSGCRRTDVRDFEVAIPALTIEKEAVVRQALSRFAGVDKASLRFDHKARKLLLRYDSMQLAKKNIELEIAKAGLEANGVTPASVVGCQSK